jgi:hypothetical protein
VRLAARAALAGAIALAIPVVELAIKCRRPESEACVWGKAYLSLSLGLWLVIGGPIVFGALTAIAALWRRGR